MNSWVGITMVMAALVVTFSASQVYADVPPNFSDVTIATGLSNPTFITEAPDGRLFLNEQCGDIHIIQNDVLIPTPFAQITTACGGFEIGLHSLVFDPDFANNGYIYVFYSVDNPLHNRVSRFTQDPQNANQVLAGSELILLDMDPVLTDTHMSGAMVFLPDGTLLITAGDGYDPVVSQDMTTNLGKILRINTDGSIPSDNPFVGQQGVAPEIYSSGWRNPFTMHISSTGVVRAGEVGQANWEEINEVVAGGNYGWPICEGDCNTPPYIDPLYTYEHPNPGQGVTGGAANILGPFYEGTQFPVDFAANSFFADYVQGWIKRLTPTNQVIDFASNLGFPVGMEVSSDGSLYYITIFPGTLHKITYDLSNGAPTAVAAANPLQGLPPLLVTFDGSGSSDPDTDPLTYTWDFGDGSPTANGVNVQHTYANAGAYTAVLTVDDGKGGVNIDDILINVGNPPVGTILTPAVGTFYDAGTVMGFSGSATDVEDGTLPDSAYEWTIVFHHNTHTHPYNNFNGISSGNFNIDTINETDPDVFYRIYMTVTDSHGLQHTTFRDVQPNLVNITLDSNIPGLTVYLDSSPKVTPYTYESVVGITRTIDSPAKQILTGITYDWVSWSDAGAKNHQIVHPATDTTITGTYVIGTPGTFSLTIDAVDWLGNPWNGWFTTVHEGATLLQTGFTPMVFVGTGGNTYTAETQDFEDFHFVEWENGSQISARNVYLDRDMTITATYTDSNADTTPPTVSANPAGGTFMNQVLVSLTANDNIDPNPTIYYTTNGFPATAASPVYTGPITVTADTTINFIAVDSSGNTTPDSLFETYYIVTNDTVPPVVSATPPAGTYLQSVDVTITANDAFDPNPTIYYTTDGSTPTTASPVYTGPIHLTSDTTVKCIAEDNSGNISAVDSQSYVIAASDTNAPSVSANPTGGSFPGSVAVTLSATDDFDPNPSIYYTTDGSTPTTASTLYAGSIVLTADGDIKFIGEDASGNVSPVSTESYTITPVVDPVLTVVSLDLLGDPFPGFYTTIYDGPTPVTTGFTTVQYTGVGGTTYSVEVQDYLQYEFDHWEDLSTANPRNVLLNADTTVIAYYKDASVDTIPPTVSASPTAGTYLSPLGVTLTAVDAADPNPSIYYTTDGSTPTTASTLYTGPLSLTVDTTVKFMAADASGNESPVSTEAYVLVTSDTTPPSVSASPVGGTYGVSVDVTLSATDDLDPSPSIYYTLDGSTPTTASPLYTAPITLTVDTTIKFIGEDSSGNVSPVSTEAYVITPATTSEVTIETVDSAGNEIFGYWVDITQGGSSVASGFSPVTTTVNNGETYEVFVGDWAGVEFDYWDDLSTVLPRSFSISTDTTLTAWYTP